MGVFTNELHARNGSRQFPNELLENWSNNKKLILIGCSGMFVQIGMIIVYIGIVCCVNPVFTFLN